MRIHYIIMWLKQKKKNSLWFALKAQKVSELYLFLTALVLKNKIQIFSLINNCCLFSYNNRNRMYRCLSDFFSPFLGVKQQ